MIAKIENLDCNIKYNCSKCNKKFDFLNEDRWYFRLRCCKCASWFTFSLISNHNYNVFFGLYFVLESCEYDVTSNCIINDRKYIYHNVSFDDIEFNYNNFEKEFNSLIERELNNICLM